MEKVDRVLVHLSNHRRVVIDPAKVYLLEAVRDETLIRSRGKHTMRDVRSMGEVLPSFQPHGFLRVHRNHAVNLRRVREIRRRANVRGWELRLQPPVNQVLPIGETHLAALWQAFRTGR